MSTRLARSMGAHVPHASKRSVPSTQHSDSDGGQDAADDAHREDGPGHQAEDDPADHEGDAAALAKFNVYLAGYQVV